MATQTTSGKWYAIDCDCGFTAKSHNNAEMEEIGMVHVKRTHPDMKLGPADVRKFVKAV